MPFDPEILDEHIREVGQFNPALDLSVFITHSATFLDAVLADEDIPDPLFRLIGIYIAAHFAYLQQGQIKSDKVDVLTTTFNMESDLALNSTTHGQQALALDPSGKLGTLNAQSRQGKNPAVLSRGAFITII